MLWDPSVLGLVHPEMCPGGDQWGRNSTLGSCGQELLATHGAGVKPFTSLVFPRETGKRPGKTGDLLMFFSSTGAAFPWCPAGRCLSTDLVLRGVRQRGEGSPGCPNTASTPARSWREDAAQMSHRCPCMGTTCCGVELSPLGCCPGSHMGRGAEVAVGL